jgi:hypothetical protein
MKIYVPPKAVDTGKAETGEKYDSTEKSIKEGKAPVLALNKELKKPFTSDGSSREGGEPNTLAVSTVDERRRVQPHKTLKRKKKQKRRDLRIMVLKNNLKKLVTSDWRNRMRQGPNIVADLAEVSDWARDADIYLRYLFLPKRQANYTD